jgi:hypothetical protein
MPTIHAYSLSAHADADAVSNPLFAYDDVDSGFTIQIDSFRANMPIKIRKKYCNNSCGLTSFFKIILKMHQTILQRVDHYQITAP